MLSSIIKHLHECATKTTRFSHPISYTKKIFLQMLLVLSFMACHVEITIFKIVRVVWRSASSITTSTTSSNTFKFNIKNVVLTLQRRK